MYGGTKTLEKRREAVTDDRDRDSREGERGGDDGDILFFASRIWIPLWPHIVSPFVLLSKKPVALCLLRPHGTPCTVYKNRLCRFSYGRSRPLFSETFSDSVSKSLSLSLHMKLLLL